MARYLVPQSRLSGELSPGALQAIIASTGKMGAMRFLDFFTSNIRNPNTRCAYVRAVMDFLNWLQKRKVTELADVQPIHVSGYIEELQHRLRAPSVKQHLAAIRMLLDWLVTGQVIPTNPAHSVRGPRHSAKKGKTPVLAPEEARDLLDSIKIARTVKLEDGTEKEEPWLVGLRDRALIGLMVYTFARVGAAVAMNVEDYYWQGRRWWVRLHEKGGKRHEMPAHDNLDEYLAAYLAAAKIADDKKGRLFRTGIGKTGELTEKTMAQVDVYRMIKRRAKEAGIKTEIGCHTFWATGITAYLKNGGRLEVAQQMAAHESARTTGLYDRRGDEISLDEVERIAI